jgi:hypothetical protein
MRLSLPCLPLGTGVYINEGHTTSNDPNGTENWDLIPCLIFEKCPVHIGHISVHS